MGRRHEGWRRFGPVLALALLSAPAWGWVYWEGPDTDPSWPGGAAVDTRGDVVFAERLGSYWKGAFRVTKLSGATGFPVWGPIRLGGPAMCGEGNGTAVDALGDVFVAGYLSDTCDDWHPDFIVAKLAGADGVVRWIRRFAGVWRAQGVVVAPDGDVIAFGNRLLVKLSGETGDERWHLDDGGGYRGFGSVAVNAAGTIAVGGSIFTDRYEGVTMALDGATGTELWQYRLVHDADQSLWDLNAQIAPDGTVVTAAHLASDVADFHVTAVVRLAPDGTEEWRHDVIGFGPMAKPQLDPEGAVYLAGRKAETSSFFLQTFFEVLKLTPGGAEAWHVVTGVRWPDGWAIGGAGALAVRDGTVFVTGQTSDPIFYPGPYGSRTMALDAGSGAVRWHRVVDVDGEDPHIGAQIDRIADLSLDVAGDVIVTATWPLPDQWYSGNSAMTVFKLDGRTGRPFACGNGVLDAGEQCDDGHVDDRCDAPCPQPPTTSSTTTASTTTTSSIPTSSVTTSTSSSTTTTMPECRAGVSADCDDGDPCTDDGCSAPGICLNAPRLHFVGLRCRLDEIQRSLRAASPADIRPQLRRRLLERVRALRALAEQAERCGDGCRETRLRKMAAGLGTLDRALARGAVLGRIPAGLAAAVREMVGDAVTALGTVSER